MNFRSYIFILVFLNLSRLSPGQTINEFIEQYNNFSTNLIEILNIQTDRELYLSGETIFFSISGYEGMRNKSHISDIACIELLDGKNEVVSRQRIASDYLHTYGRFTISPDSESGYYTLQAYTRWSTNFETSLIAIKHIKIINPHNTRAITTFTSKFKEKPWYQLEILPSCKELSTGIENKIVVKSFNKFLCPEPGTGTILNNQLTPITDFKIDSTGLGHFHLIPGVDDEYYLRFVSEKKDTIFRKLLKAVPGIYLDIEKTQEKRVINWKYSPGYQLDKKASLLVLQGIKIVHIEENLDFSTTTTSNLPLELEPGLYTAYLVDENLEIISQRNFTFYNPILQINISLDKSTYKTRDKVTVMFNSPGSKTKGSIYEILSIKQHKILHRNRLITLLDNTNGLFHVTPEWMNIYVPDSVSTEHLFDLWALTQEPVISLNKLQKIYTSTISKPPEYRGEIISGQVRNKADNTAVPGQLIAMAVYGDNVQFFNTFTDPNGYFYFYNHEVTGAHQVTIASIPPENNKTIFIDNNYQGNIITDTLPPVLTDEKHRTEFEDLYQSVLVNQAFRSAANKTRAEPTMKNFYGEADFTLFMDRYIELPVMEEVFFEIVRNVIIIRSGGEKKLRVVDDNTKKVIGDSTLILVDGIPYFNSDYALRLMPGNVESIRVVSSKYYLENMSFDGIIDIRTRLAETRTSNLPPGALRQTYNFKVIPDKPVFPEYLNETAKEDRLPDFRNVLYWDPEVEHDRANTFYTSDQPGEYMVLIRKITKGKVTAIGKQFFHVEKN